MKKETKKGGGPWAAMDAILAEKLKSPEEGWFTAEQFAKRYGYSLSGAMNKLRGFSLDGMVERRRFRAQRTGTTLTSPTKSWWKMKG